MNNIPSTNYHHRFPVHASPHHYRHHRFYGPQVPFGADLPDIQCALDHPGLRWIRRPNIVLDGDQTLLCTACPENTIYLKSN